MRTRVASPGDPYLNRIGELAYVVTSLEGLLIFDIPRLAATLPVGALDIAELQALPAGSIAGRFTAAAPAATDPRTRTYFEVGGASLGRAARIRNDVLHARPATIGGEQRLYRVRKDGVAFNVDDEWLDQALGQLQAELDAVNAVRPSFSDFPPT